MFSLMFCEKLIKSVAMSKQVNFFFRKDIRQMKALGVKPDAAREQLLLYRQGSRCLVLNRPCAVRDGIIAMTAAQKKKCIDLYDNSADKYKIVSFVPASGAASRMFSGWFTAAEKGVFGTRDQEREFFRDLKKMPFFPLIAGDEVGGRILRERKIGELLKFILEGDGLNYGNLPKALIPFHRYPSGKLRTALAEHLAEAGEYIAGIDGVSNLHFTVAAEHKRQIRQSLKNILAQDEFFYGKKYQITLSVQSDATNTIAVDAADKPLRDANGKLVFRPGGHGTLLENLNNLNADFVFIKNIDNIAPRPLSARNVLFRKMLGGMAMKIQQKIFAFLQQLEAGAFNDADFDHMTQYCAEALNIVFPNNFAQQGKNRKIKTVFSLLNRPLRVCGVVRNVGEPGGGPFWVEEKDGTQTPQIVESGHVDKSSPAQLAIWSRAKYFNPVDMVCSLKNHHGETFRLLNYANRKAYLITTKIEKGITFKALEVPGLWNGAMAYWNTIFVRLPAAVFNPVKTVDDLLRPAHRSTSKLPFPDS